ncbi:Hypothetical protein POVR1_LOCUS547 [uncultured virus]|nr:Hypothetical protein POVR1_LOCUS547 [uncultured virus]
MSRDESLTVEQANEFEHFVSHEIIHPFESLTQIQKVKIDIWYRALDIFSNLVDRTETRLQMIIQAHARAITEQNQSLPTPDPTEPDQPENGLTTGVEPEESIQTPTYFQIGNQVEFSKCRISTPTIEESYVKTTHFMCQSHEFINDPREFHRKHSKYKDDKPFCHSLVWFHPKHSKYKSDILSMCHSPVLFHPKHSKHKDCLPTAVTSSFYPKYSKHRHRCY